MTGEGWILAADDDDDDGLVSISDHVYYMNIYSLFPSILCMYVQFDEKHHVTKRLGEGVVAGLNKINQAMGGGKDNNKK